MFIARLINATPIIWVILVQNLLLWQINTYGIPFQLPYLQPVLLPFVTIILYYF